MNEPTEAKRMLAAICVMMEQDRSSPLWLAVGVIAAHVLRQPDWLPNLPDEDRTLLEGVLLFSAGSNDVVH